MIASEKDVQKSNRHAYLASPKAGDLFTREGAIRVGQNDLNDPDTALYLIMAEQMGLSVEKMDDEESYEITLFQDRLSLEYRNRIMSLPRITLEESDIIHRTLSMLSWALLDLTKEEEEKLTLSERILRKLLFIKYNRKSAPRIATEEVPCDD